MLWLFLLMGVLTVGSCAIAILGKFNEIRTDYNNAVNETNFERQLVKARERDIAALEAQIADKNVVMRMLLHRIDKLEGTMGIYSEVSEILEEEYAEEE